MAAAEESRAVGFDLRRSQYLALDDRLMGRPDLRFAGRALATRGQDGAEPGDILRLHEELRESRVRRIRSGRREHELAIRCDLDVLHRGCWYS